MLERLSNSVRMERRNIGSDRVKEWVSMASASRGKHFESLFDTLSSSCKQRIKAFENIFK
jgi:hypothetical protein